MKLFGNHKSNNVEELNETIDEAVEEAAKEGEAVEEAAAEAVGEAIKVQEAVEEAVSETVEKAAEAESLIEDLTEQNDAHEEARKADPDRLFLDIEGLDEQKPEEPLLALKAETKELPDRNEVLIAALQADLGITDSPEPEKKADGAAENEEKTDDAPAESSDEDAPLSSVSYASVAKAVVSAKKEATGRFNRDAIDDETLLAELYALIGPGSAAKPAQQTEADAEPAEEIPVPKPVSSGRSVPRITPEELQAAPEEFEELPEDDSVGVPGWVKGAFILLISLLLSAMTFYAVASDVLGKIF